MPHKEYKNWPSVTQILSVINKPFLNYWYGKYGTKKCEQIKRESQEIGTAFHLAMYQYLTSSRKPINNLAKVVIKQWIKKHEVVSIALEDAAHVMHNGLKYHGTPDFVGIVDGVHCIIDWKSSSRIDKIMPLQLAMYALAWNFTNREPVIDCGIVVRVDKKTLLVEVQEYKELVTLQPIIEGVIKLWHYLQNVKKP